MKTKNMYRLCLSPFLALFIIACGADPNANPEEMLVSSDVQDDALRKKRANPPGTLWPDGVIPYACEDVGPRFGPNKPECGTPEAWFQGLCLFDVSQQEQGFKRIGHLRFVKRTNEKDYVYFRLAQPGTIRDPWQASHFGMKGGRQDVYFDSMRALWPEAVQAMSYAAGVLNKKYSEHFGDPKHTEPFTSPLQKNGDAFLGYTKESCYYHLKAREVYAAEAERFAGGVFYPADEVLYPEGTEFAEGVCTAPAYITAATEYDHARLQVCEVMDTSFSAQGFGGACSGAYEDYFDTDLRHASFPNIKEIRYNLSLQGYAQGELESISFPNLEKVAGSIFIRDQGALKTISFPNLKSVGGEIFIENNSAVERVELPSLTKLDGSLYIRENKALKRIEAPRLNKLGKRRLSIPLSRRQPDVLIKIDKPGTLELTDNKKLEVLDLGPQLIKRKNVRRVKIKKNGSFPKCTNRRKLAICAS